MNDEDNFKGFPFFLFVYNSASDMAIMEKSCA